MKIEKISEQYKGDFTSADRVALAPIVYRDMRK